MFDERHFPYAYECEGGSATATVTHEDIQKVPALFATKPVAEAVEYVVTERRNWSSFQSFEGAWSPDCAEWDGPSRPSPRRACLLPA